MNSSVKRKIIDFFNKYYWKQHPEAALRYAPVVRAIKKANLEDSKILEVGSGSLGIVPYLKRQIDGIDIDFSGPQTKLLNQIKAKGVDLPFRRNSYDVVVCSDVLEHIKKENREKAVFEILRVAKKQALIVVPTGELSEKQDEKLADIWAKKMKGKNLFLDEHIENGLPKNEEILVYIDRSLRKLKKTAKVKSYPILNLHVREILMRTWITNNKYIYYFYMKGMLLFLPILKRANFKNCYRRFFVIEFAS